MVKSVIISVHGTQNDIQDYSIHEVSTKRTISSITAGRKVVTELIIENNCMLND